MIHLSNVNVVVTMEAQMENIHSEHCLPQITALRAFPAHGTKKEKPDRFLELRT